MAISNTVIQIKKSGVTGNVPSSLNLGELALNYVDNKLFYTNASGGTSWFYGANNGPSFSTVSNGTSLITATAPNDTLTFATANGISISTNSSTKIITVGMSGITSTPTLNITGDIPTISTTTGSLIVTGGIGVSGNVYANGIYAVSALYANGISVSGGGGTSTFPTLNVTGNIPTTSNTTGSLIVTGGIGVSGNVYSTGSQSVFRGNVNIGSVVTNSNYPLDVASSSNDTTVRSFTSAAGAWFMAYSTSGYYAGMKYVGANGARNWFSGMGNNNQAYTIAMSTDSGSNRFFTIDTTGYISLAGAPGSESFRAAPVANSVNYLQVAGAATGGYPALTALGSDANIGLLHDAKGSGIQYFRAQNSTVQFAVGAMANAVNYLMTYGGTAGNYPVLTPVGSDANIGFVFNSKGTAAVSFQTNYFPQAQITYTANSVNYLSFTGGATGAAPTISTLSYTDANVSMNITSQGFGVTNINSGSGTIARFTDRGTTTVDSPFTFKAGLIGVQQGAFTLPVSVSIQVPDNIFQFRTQASTSGAVSGGQQFGISHTASAVNYVNVTGSAANNAPTISALGSDANINLSLAAKGNGLVSTGAYQIATTGGIYIGSSNNYIYQASANSLGFRVGTAPSYFQFTDNAGAIGLTTGNPFYFTGWSGGYTFKIEGSASANVVNYLSVGTANTKTSPTLYATGSDTNVSLALQPKGTGSINLVAGANGINFGSGTFISSIKFGQSGVGYTSFPTVVVSAPTMQGGTQAVAGAINSMKNVTATVQSGGTGYTVGDVLSIVGGVIQASNGTLTVATVSSGVITAVNTTNFAPYGTPLQANPVSVTGGTGTGATFNIGYGVYSGSVSLTNAGSGYIESPTITITGGGTPSINAIGYATVGNGTIFESLGSSLSLYTSLGEQLRVIDGPLSASGGITNYVGIAGSATGLNPTISVAGTDSNITMAFQQKGTGNFQFNGSGTVALQVFTTPLSSVNYFRLSPALTNNPPTINALGSDANVGLRLSPQGTGSVIVTGPMTVANTVNAVSQFAVSLQPNFSTSTTWANTAATFGGIAAGGSSAAAAVGIAFDSTNGGTLASVSPGQGWYNMRYWAQQHSFATTGSTQFNISNTGSAVNYLQVTGGATNNEPLILAQGSDTNVSLALQSKGSGGIDFAAGANGVSISNGTGVTSLQITSIGSGYTTVPTVTISAPNITGGVTATANTASMGLWGIGVNFGGTGYSVNDVLTLVGGTVATSAVTVRVTTISANVITGITALNYGSYSALPTNPISVTGGTGTGANLSATWCVYSVNLLTSGSGYVEQPTVTFSAGGGAVAALGYATVGSVANIKALGSQLTLQTANTQTSIQLLDDATVPIVNTALYVVGASSGLGRLALRSNKALYLSTGFGNPLGFFTNGSTTSDGSPQLNITHTASVNYLNITGGATNGAPVLSAAGSDTNVSILIAPKGTGSVALGGVAVANSSLQVTSVTNSVNYINVTGAVSGTWPTLAATGIDASIGMFHNTKGNGGYTFATSGLTQAYVAHTASAVNYIQLTGSANGSASAISTQGSDTDITLNISAKNNGSVNIYNGNGLAVRFYGGLNYLTLAGAGSGGATTMVAGGYDANINVLISPKGTGSVALGGSAVANSSLQVSSVTNSVNYIKVDGGASGSGPQISAVGYDTNLSLGLFQKGTGGIYLGGSYTYPSVLISTPVNAVNSFQIYGNSAGGAVALNAIGADTNIPISITAKGTGGVILAGNGQQIFTAINASGTDFTNYYNTTGQLNYTAAGGSTNINFAFTSKGTGSYIFTTGGGRQAQITDTTSAVNYLQFTGAANTASPTISAQGSDSNINLKLLPKGTGYLYVGNIVNIGADYSIGATISAAGQTSAVVGTSLQGFYNAQTIDSTKTAGFNIFSSFISTAAAAFNINTIAHYKAAFFTLGAGSSITNQYGFIADGSLSNATNNYGFYSGINAASGRYNFYANGTADNVFVGQTSLGGYAGSEALRAVITPSSVNYVQVSGATSGNSVTISAKGSDANVSLFLTPKGTGNVTVTSTTASTSNTTGALVVSGGLGVSGNVYAGTIYASGAQLTTRPAVVVYSMIFGGS